MRHINLHAAAFVLTVIIVVLAGCDKRQPLLPTSAGATTFSPARQNAIETRGELLYSTYCFACHTVEIHWREKLLATDMESLRKQVYRWQASIGLYWSKDEIEDVTGYLNAAYYGFQDADHKGFLEQGKPLQAQH